MTNDMEQINDLPDNGPQWLRSPVSSLGFLLGVMFIFASVWLPMVNSSYPIGLLEKYVWPLAHLITLTLAFVFAFRHSTKGKLPHHGVIWLIGRGILVGIGVELILLLSGFVLVPSISVQLGNILTVVVWGMLSIIMAWAAGRLVGRSAIADGPDAPRCPACGYVLYHARDSRCPECGRVFSLNEMNMRLAVTDDKGVLQPRSEATGGKLSDPT